MIPAPLRQLITERDSLKAQVDKMEQDFAMLQNEKQKAIEEFDKKIDDLLLKKEKLQTEWAQFNDAVEAMKVQYKLPIEEQIPPEEELSAT